MDRQASKGESKLPHTSQYSLLWIRKITRFLKESLIPFSPSFVRSTFRNNPDQSPDCLLDKIYTESQQQAHLSTKSHTTKKKTVSKTIQNKRTKLTINEKLEPPSLPATLTTLHSDSIDNKIEEESKHEIHLDIIKPSITCPICLSQTNEDNFSSMPQCQHLFCKICMTQYLETQIKSSDILNIKCPDASCKNVFQDTTIESNVSKAVYSTYIKYKSIRILQTDPNVRFCTRVSCNRTIKGSMWNPHVKCECGEEICFKCGESWHQDKSCNDAVQNGFKAFGIDVKLCPKCHSRSFKEVGCDRVVCKRCRHIYCWKCLGEYRGTHKCNQPVRRDDSFLMTLAVFCCWPMLYALFIPWTAMTSLVYGIYLHIFVFIVIPIIAIRRMFFHLKGKYKIWSYLALLISSLIFPLFGICYVIERVFLCQRFQLRFAMINQDVRTIFRRTAPPMMSRRVDSRDVEVTLGIVFSALFYYLLWWLIVSQL